MENARKVFKRLRRMRGKYLSVDGDYVKSGLLAVSKSSPYARKVFKRIWRMRGKDLCVNGDGVFSKYAKRCKSVNISENNNTN
jgi:hypothetical protein